MLMNFSQNKVLAERKITFESIVASDSPSVMKMMRDDYGLLFKFVLAVVTDYLNYAYPQMINVSNTFSADLIESRPTWKAEDFINLFKYFRQNPTESYGQMTPEKLMLRVNEYEEKRAEAMEEFHQRRKSEAISGGAERRTPDELEKANMKGDIERAKGTWKNWEKQDHKTFFEK